MLSMITRMVTPIPYISNYSHIKDQVHQVKARIWWKADNIQAFDYVLVYSESIMNNIAESMYCTT